MNQWITHRYSSRISLAVALLLAVTPAQSRAQWNPAFSLGDGRWAGAFLPNGDMLEIEPEAPESSRVHDDTLAGVIDFHTHSGPDSHPRSVSDLELAQAAKEAGMRGLVFKNHYTMTADRAALVMEAVPGIEIFGGVALNRAVGGLNAEAVRQMAQFEGGRGKIVWLPTFDAQYWVTRDGGDGAYVPVVIDGRPAPELGEIFQIIAENDLVLALGHSSPEEDLLLLPEAKRWGVRKVVATHVLEQNPTREQLEKLAEEGVILELAWPEVLRFTIEDYVEVIRSIGAQHFLIASDLGQAQNPLHTFGMKDFILALREQGISDGEINLMARENPARLLGLDAASPRIHGGSPDTKVPQVR